MFLTQATFGTPSSSTDAAAYLGSLQKNGQILGEHMHLHALCNGVYTAYVRLARPDASELRFHSKYASIEREEIRREFGSEPQWRVLADDVPNDFHDFQTSSFLFLFTSAFNGDSPICCGDTDNRLPTYLIPLDDDEREGLCFWACEYNRIHGIWLASGDLEIPAYEQMASPQSTLAEQGRAVSRKVEQALGVPTYYFLERYYGRGDQEQNRRCPGCNAAWRIPKPNQRAPGLLKLHFRCEKCRLVSYDADAAYDDEWAHIGEFDSSQKRHDQPE